MSLNCILRGTCRTQWKASRSLGLCQNLGFARNASSTPSSSAASDGSKEGTECPNLGEVLEAGKEFFGSGGKETATEDEVSKQQGVLWFGNVYPAKTGWFDFRQVF